MRRLQLVMSSIGKKELMALSGLALIGFLVAHLAGNTTILSGAEALDGYGAKLEALGPVVYLAEAGLAVLFLGHAALGINLVLTNLQARGQRYAVKQSEGGRTFGSWTMWVTGPWILSFLALHLWHFTVQHKAITHAPLSELVAERMADPFWMGYYVFSMLAVGLHVSHGVWSALQTLGAAPSRTGLVRDASVLIGIVFGLGFALLAFFVFMVPGLLG